MKEVFQNYEHYSKWMIQNWNYQTTDLDKKIIENGLLVKIEHHNENAFRLMFKSEFKEKEKIGFIFVPTVEQADA